VKENGSVMPLNEYPVNIVLKDKKILEDYVVGIQRPGRDIITWTLISAVPEFDSNNTIIRVLITFMDITERKQTDEALLEREKLFRRLSESLPMGIFQTDMDGRVLYLNDRLCSITGLDRQDALGYGWSSALHPEDKPHIIEEWEECLKEKKGYSGEFRFVRPTGDVQWVYARTSPIKSAEGDIIGHVGAIGDITERKKAEEEIIRLAKFPSENPNPVMRISHDGSILYNNIPSTPLLKLWSTEENRITTGEILEVIQKALDTETSHVTEADCIDTIYSLTFAPVAESGYVNVYGLDITKLKKAEEELHQYEHIVSSSTDMMALLDKQFCYIAANTAYLKAFNISYDELIGYTVSQVFGEEFFKEIFKPKADSCLTGKEINYQAWFDFPIDGKRYMDITYYPYFDTDNKVMGFVVNGRNITDRKKTEEKHKKLEAKILHTQKLESLGVLAGGIAHDFNNLLVAILGNAELALMDMAPESPVYESVEEIKNASVRASELTRQMLAYSGKGQFVVKAIDINRLIDEMGHILEVSISKNAVLKYNFYKNLPSVYADASQIRQIIMNLIINASEAIGEKSGIITISTGLIDAKRDYLSQIRIDEFLSEGYYVFIEVSDTGCGMDKEVQDKLFDPFFSTKFTGRGLGLSAVQGIVRGHTGAIKVYSEPEKGSTFKILLPCPDLLLNVPEIETDTESLELTAKGTVLVVDDEETVRAYVSRILERLGFKVLTAKDGREGVEKFRTYTDEISLVLLDMTMPHMDGKEAFSELKKINPDISVILSSGYNEQEATSYFTGKGLAGFIQKPFQIDTLVAKLRDVLH
ncbi:PAS domain S-box protein, partial [Candidatus Omnitrophota bacterium]